MSFFISFAEIKYENARVVPKKFYSLVPKTIDGK